MLLELIWKHHNEIAGHGAADERVHGGMISIISRP